MSVILILLAIKLSKYSYKILLLRAAAATLQLATCTVKDSQQFPSILHVVQIHQHAGCKSHYLNETNHAGDGGWKCQQNCNTVHESGLIVDTALPIR